MSNKSFDKADKILDHLQDHPQDYQSVVSYFIARSDGFKHEMEKSKNLHQREISKYQGGNQNGKQA